MEIKTKFNIGDTPIIVFEQGIRNDIPIASIHISVVDNHTSISYSFVNPKAGTFPTDKMNEMFKSFSRDETQCFATTDELLKSFS